jgi:hypothetical protein
MSTVAIERPPASPYGTYAMVPRRCTDCGGWPVVSDGRYWCAACHPDKGEHMPVPTLTAGGKAAPARPKATPPDPTHLLNRWHLILTQMLEHAVKYGELDDLVQKRRAWLADNPFHEKHDERHAAMWQTAMERNEVGGHVMDLAAELSRIQRDMPADMVNGIEALMGHELFPYAGQKWAMAAARWPKHDDAPPPDIFDVASWVSMELTAADETPTERAA